jgi:hypothetical protein
MAQRTRKEIIAEIMNWSATWGSPLSREQAEAKADQTIKAMRKATRPRWGWFILFMILLLQLSLTSSELALARGSPASGAAFACSRVTRLFGMRTTGSHTHWGCSKWQGVQRSAWPSQANRGPKK